MNKSDEERLIAAFGFKADGIKQSFSLETKAKNGWRPIQKLSLGGGGRPPSSQVFRG